MPWIRQIPDEEAEGLLARLYREARERSGRVWNIVRLTGINPRQTRAHLALYREIMHQASELPPRVRETLAVVVSDANACHY